MRNLILNAGGMSANSAGIAAMEAQYAGCKKVALITYGYIGDPATAVAAMRKAFPSVNFVPVGITDAKKTLLGCDGIQVLGGNSFVLADQLYAHGLLDTVKQMVDAGVPYAGASAGANVAGPSVCTTNDMPILRNIRSLAGFGLVPFQINPHYLDPSAMPAGFRGETREDRIREFHAINDVPVIGLREGTWLKVQGNAMTLEGNAGAMIFERGKQPQEVAAGSDLSWMLLITPRFTVPTYGDVAL